VSRADIPDGRELSGMQDYLDESAFLVHYMMETYVDERVREGVVSEALWVPVFDGLRAWLVREN
jgi:hypothetical protein